MKKWFDRAGKNPAVRAGALLLIVLLLRYGIGYAGQLYITLLFYKAGLYSGAAYVPGWAQFLSEAGDGILLLLSALVVMLAVKPKRMDLKKGFLFITVGTAVAVISMSSLILIDSVRYSPGGWSVATVFDTLGTACWSFAAAASACEIGRRAAGERSVLVPVGAAIAFLLLAPVAGGGWLQPVNLILIGLALGKAAERMGSSEASAGFAAWVLALEGAFGAFTGRGWLRIVSEAWLVGITPASSALTTAVAAVLLVILYRFKIQNRRQ